ncbi:Hypothetical protein AA314_08224 [Archangium gephyra]|uniref:Uncharacterized protein n=1 Tax=Archangium gephyra TaxID=48 RepID=A0AAC8THX5_9BACT|nr:Hypothetical protein AA314_08224 [Archangium gephyra]
MTKNAATRTLRRVSFFSATTTTTTTATQTAGVDSCVK